MYLRRVHIKNIRSIAELEWRVPAFRKAGWHVVIGDNGSGKSTFLRAIALALVGADEAAALRQDWNDWLRKGEERGRVEVEVGHDPQRDGVIVYAAAKPGSPHTFGVEFSRETNGTVVLRNTGGFDPNHNLWRDGRFGWFSAAYGPFRRFTGGDQESEKLFSTNPRLAAHLSIFGENIALTECLQWLRELKFKQLEQRREGGLLDRIIAFVNQEGFLPHHAKLTEISSKGVFFVDGEGSQLPVEELSDGYRSVLSMTFDLIRQMSTMYKVNDLFAPENSSKIIASGVVLIDEVDAHLHPTWQRSIGLWFREHFPNLQFIVTTHSPLVCQAADVGTIWRLPKPGSGEAAVQVTGTALNRLLYGDVLDAYGTELFGQDVARSDEALKLLARLAELNRKSLRGKLTKKEREEQAELRVILSTDSHVLTEHL